MSTDSFRGPRPEARGPSVESGPEPDARGPSVESGPEPDARRGPLVGIVLGSDSDRPVMEEAARTLAAFGIACEITVASAHRSPELLDRYARSAEERGIRVLIAAAGGAAHLAGALAARTVLPVIGVPLDATGLGGLDALLSTVQMPPGVPVAAVSIGSWGARNAGILAVQILAAGEPELRERLREFKANMARKIEGKAETAVAESRVTSRQSRGS